MSVRSTELSHPGWHVVFASTGLFVVGALFANAIVLTLASLLLLYLLADGIVFHRTLTQARISLTAESRPQTVTCTVGEKTELESAIRNRSNSDFRIIRISRVCQDKVLEEAPLRSLLLARHEKATVKMGFECVTPGRFRTSTVEIRMISRWKALSASISLQDETVVVVRPRLDKSRYSSVDTSLIEDLTSDPIRRGAGTDLAGIRPSVVLDSSHRIGWKATARTGQLMVKEFYLERQPPVMLFIDVSLTMRRRIGRQSTFDDLVSTALPRFLASLRPETPIGVSLYTEDSILLEIPARVGKQQNELIIRALLPHTGQEFNPSYIFPRKSEDGAFQNPNHQSAKSFNRILLFRRDVSSRYMERLRGQGIFTAFRHLCDVREPALVIVVTDGKTNLDGLIEGTKAATRLGHRVLVAFLTTHQRISTSYTFSELEAAGVNIRECLPKDLPSIVNAEISRINRGRFIPQ